MPTRATGRTGPRTADRVYAAGLVAFGLAIPAILLAILGRVALASWPAVRTYGIEPLTRTEWNPAAERFGALGFVFGTVATALLALLLAVPLAVGLAVFLTELAPRWLAAPVAAATDLLAAVPSVVYGLWGVYVLVPWIREWVASPIAASWGARIPALAGPVYGFGVVAASVLLAIMIIPFVAAVTREVLAAVPRDQREAALALGATRWETASQVALPYARAGIVGGAILGLGRALGETMAVTMVIGNRAEIPKSIWGPSHTLAGVLANEFAEASDQAYLAALMELALLLLGISVVVNAAARLLVWRVRDPRSARA